MRMHPFHRTELLVGGSDFERLQRARFCVIGLGGVGSYVVEALARAGVGHLTLVDFDRVCITNLNRQLHATRKTVNRFKADLMHERVLAIHPRCEVVAVQDFYCEERSEQILSPGFDGVVDCIDQMSAKLHLLEQCVRRDQPVWSAMGAGGVMDPTQIRVSDLSEVRNDPFARIVRKQLRKRGIEGGIECVWSDELPNDLDPSAQEGFRCVCPDKDLKQQYSCESRFQVQGSVSWMPSLFGLTLAGVAINRLLQRPLSVDQPTFVRQRKAPRRPTDERRRELLTRAGFDRAEGQR